MAIRTIGTTVIDSQDTLGLSPEQVQKFLAVTDKFGTTIEGALIQTVMMLLREANTTNVTAGISGLQGLDLEKPSIWSGGDLVQATRFRNLLNAVKNGTPLPTEAIANFVVNHDGSVRVGKYIIDTAGNINIINPSTGKVIISISDNLIPTVVDVSSNIPANAIVNLATTISNTVSAYATGPTADIQEKFIIGSLIVPKSGGNLRVTGTFKASGDGSGQNNRVGSYIELFRDGRFFSFLSGVGYENISGNTTYHNRAVSEFFNTVPQGTYTIRITAKATNYSNPALSSTGTFNVGKLEWTYEGEEYNRLYIGDGGIIGSFGDEYMSFSKDGLKTNTGGLFMFSGASYQGQALTQKVGLDRYNFSISKEGVGVYRLTHNIGHTNYKIVFVSDINNGAEAMAFATTGISAMIQIKKYGSYADSWFTFSVYSI